MKAWLWPNRVISSAESARLREEHNKAVQQIEDLRETLKKIHRSASVQGRWLLGSECVHAEGHDEHEEEFPPSEPEAEWTTYELEEQNAALESIAHMAKDAMDKTEEEP